MFRAIQLMTVLIISITCATVWLADNAGAQSSGSRGGVPTNAPYDPGLPELDRETAQQYIVIEGSAEVRVRPTEIRVVLAIISEAETAKASHDEIQGIISTLKAEWSKLQIGEKDITVDFISVLPRYEWTFEKLKDKEVAIERRVGYRMQTNVHLAVREEQAAQAAIATAFAQGVTDIIAFDYWSEDVDDAKKRASTNAVAEARRKAEVLLFSQVGKPLPVINVQEQTRVLEPEKLYHSFVNSYEDTVERPVRRDLPLVRAFRPQNTYYRGPQIEVDVQARELPMKPEISVVSRVRLYFKSPAARNVRQERGNVEEPSVPAR